MKARFNGQKSNNRKTQGSVTSMGLASSPRINGKKTNRYLFTSGFLAYAAYASMQSIQKNVLNTFLRSAIQATDSTLRECTTKSIATNALFQYAPVTCLITRNRSRAFKA